MKEYAGISLYFYVCFGAILLYKESVLEAHDLSYAPYGLAAAKALILGKFMLIGQAIHLGERFRHKPLITWFSTSRSSSSLCWSHFRSWRRLSSALFMIAQ